MTMRAGASVLFNEVPSAPSARAASGLVYPRSGALYTLNAAGTESRVDSPDLDSGWINLTLQNGWVNLGSGYATAQYRKRRGVVHLKGLVMSGSSATAVIAQLPVGYRPAANIMFAVVTAVQTVASSTNGTPSSHNHSVSSNPDGVGVRLDLYADGSMLQNSAGTGVGYLSLNNIAFPAEA